MVRHQSTIENHLFNHLLLKKHLTSVLSTVLRFHMEHGLTAGSQNCKIASGQISKMATVTKNSKNNKISIPEPWGIFDLDKFYNFETLQYI